MIDYFVTQIKLSLMKKDTEINTKKDSPKYNTAEYLKCATATFNTPKDFYSRLQSRFSEDQPDYNLYEVVTSMYEDLIEQVKDKEFDSVGLWVTIDGEIIDSAISFRTLKDIQEYSKESVNPIVEFYKMTINKQDI